MGSCSTGIKSQLYKESELPRSAVHIAPGVNNKVLYTEKGPRGNLMSSVLATKKQKKEGKKKRQEGISGGDGYVYYLDCGHRNRSLHTSPNAPNWVH